MLTAAVATVALPNVARLHAAGDSRGVWRAYVRDSVLAAGVALVGSVIAVLTAPWAFTLWLGDDLPASRVILPAVLLHTVLGAAAGVGRATLIGMGLAGAYARVVLLYGLLNVAVSLALVAVGFGIWGVIGGTIASVAGRCLDRAAAARAAGDADAR